MSFILNRDKLLTLKKKLQSKLPDSGIVKQSGTLEDSLQSIHRKPVFKRNCSIRRNSNPKENNNHGMLHHDNSIKVHENSLLCESVRPVQLTENSMNSQNSVANTQEKQFEFAVPQARAPRPVRKGPKEIGQRTLEKINEFYKSPILTEAEASYHLMIIQKNIKHLLAKHSQKSVYENSGRTFSSNRTMSSVSDWINKTGCAAYPVAYAPSVACSSSSYDNLNLNRYGINPRMTQAVPHQNQNNLVNSQRNVQQCSVRLRRQTILRNISCREPPIPEDDFPGLNNSIRTKSGRIVQTSMYWQTGPRNKF